MTSLHSDITVVNDGGTIAIIELKNAQNLTPEHATSVRRNVLAHSRIPSADFFLVISQDRGYLWHQKGSDVPDSPPDVEFSMRDVLANYYSPGVINGWLRETELKTLVFHWLSELTIEAVSEQGATTEPLERVGFINAIRGGSAFMDTGA